MHEFWYDYAKPKYDKKAKFYYMDADSFIVHIETVDIYNEIADDVKTRFVTSNNELERPLSKEKKVIGLMEDESAGKVMTKFVAQSSKAYSYLSDDGREDQKSKSSKKCVIKRKLKFEN